MRYEMHRHPRSPTARDRGHPRCGSMVSGLRPPAKSPIHTTLHSSKPQSGIITQMNLVYYAHSYRKPDTPVVEFFSDLMRSERLIASLDPPSDRLNSAKPERHLKAADGMVAVNLQANSCATRSPLTVTKRAPGAFCFIACSAETSKAYDVSGSGFPLHVFCIAAKSADCVAESGLARIASHPLTGAAASWLTFAGSWNGSK